MNMLENTLQTILNRNDRYGPHLWAHRISADTLDLSVLPKHREEPENYRNAVIYAGQVLQAFSQEAMQRGYNVMIQSFPNLGEPELIAHVRLIPNRYGKESSNLPGTALTHLPDGQPFDKTLRSTASHYGIFILDLDKNQESEYTQRFSGCCRNGSSQQFRVLCTLSDNPFDWLKTGQWLEQLYQLKQDLPEAEFCRFEDPVSRQWVREQLEHHPHPQVMVISGE